MHRASNLAVRRIRLGGISIADATSPTFSDLREIADRSIGSIDPKSMDQFAFPSLGPSRGVDLAELRASLETYLV